MRTVDLIHQKRDGEELSPEDIATLVDGYLSGEIPDYQMSSFLMATYFSGMSDREVSAMTERMIASGETIARSFQPGSSVQAGLCQQNLNNFRKLSFPSLRSIHYNDLSFASP